MADRLTQEEIEQHVRKKAKEFVLVVPRDMIDRYEDFEMLVNYEGRYRERGSSDGKYKGVETDRHYKQIIPYFVFIRDGKILTYKKNKTSSESRLHNYYSIGIGGHVHPKDGRGMTAVRQAAIRECQEEIGVSPAITVMSRNNDDYIKIDLKGNAADYHLGYAQVVTGWHPDEIQLSEEVDNITWRTIAELEEMNLEEWSVYLLKILKKDFMEV